MEEYMEKTDGVDFMDNIEKLVGILNGMAAELDDFAARFDTSDEEIAELNTGKTKDEIDLENNIAAQIAAPLVNALDGISNIINGATAKVMEMASDVLSSKQMEGA